MKENGCALWGATENLQTHHISYEPEIVQTLCVKCHQKQHPNHGVGSGSGNGYHPLFDELKEEFLLLSEGGVATRKMVVEKLGISYMTAYLWDKILGIKRERKEVRKKDKPIKISKKTKNGLDDLKTHKRETYDDVISRLVEEGEGTKND